jgi:predicted DsbA family dithiol-disulfide isomerase
VTTAADLRIAEVDAPSPRAEDGALVLDWWVDLACPDVAGSVEIVESLRESFDDRLSVRVRHFPLVVHVWAVAAAQCHLEAVAQGRGTEYLAHALAMLDDVEGPADYVELAEHLGLDADEVAMALLDGRHAGAVRDDADEGRVLGVGSTPTFVVDGLLVDAGRTLEGAEQALRDRISTALAAP